MYSSWPGLSRPSTSLANEDNKKGVDARLRGHDGERTLRPGDEKRGEPGVDRIGDHFAGAVLGIAQAARTGEALLLARDVVRYPREGLVGEHRPAGLDLD